MKQEDYVVFDIEGQWCAVPLAAVHRIVRAAAVAPVPYGPAGLLGVLNLHGGLVPIFDLRFFFGRAGKPLSPADRFLIVNNGAGQVGIWTDAVQCIGSIEVEGNVPCGQIFEQHRGPFCGVGKWDGNTVLIVKTESLGRSWESFADGVKNNGQGLKEMPPHCSPWVFASRGLQPHEPRCHGAMTAGLLADTGE